MSLQRMQHKNKQGGAWCDVERMTALLFEQPCTFWRSAIELAFYMHDASIHGCVLQTSATWMQTCRHVLSVTITQAGPHCRVTWRYLLLLLLHVAQL
jgi:hypothetical protein